MFAISEELQNQDQLQHCWNNGFMCANATCIQHWWLFFTLTHTAKPIKWISFNKTNMFFSILFFTKVTAKNLAFKDKLFSSWKARKMSYNK
jgi:hypothetical protein